MLTSTATPEMVREWRRVYEQNRKNMTPNRKSGVEVDKYFREKYTPALFTSVEFKSVVEANILEDNFNRSKIPSGVAPDVATYQLPNKVYVGIDLCSGYFHVESENMDQMAKVYDDLFLYRGLDEADLENTFLVAQYISCQ